MKLFGNILLTLLTLVFAVVLCGTTLFAAASYTARNTFSPEGVDQLMAELDYAALELPDERGGYDSLCSTVNRTLGGLGLSFTEDEFNSAVRSFSLDTILTDFVQELRAWLFDDGSVPALDSYEIAKTMTGGINPTVMGLLSLFGDPAAMLAEPLDGVIRNANLPARLEKAEPAREILSEHTLTLALSACGVLFLLILLCRKLRLFRALVWGGCSCTAAGLLLLFAERLAAPWKGTLVERIALPESTLDLVYTPLMQGFASFGKLLALAGLTVAVVAGVICLFAGMIRRAKANRKPVESVPFMPQT